MSPTVKAAKSRCNRFSGEQCYTYENLGLFKPSAIRVAAGTVGKNKSSERL